jgi:hypothetical protein
VPFGSGPSVLILAGLLPARGGRAVRNASQEANTQLLPKAGGSPDAFACASVRNDLAARHHLESSWHSPLCIRR